MQLPAISSELPGIVPTAERNLKGRKPAVKPVARMLENCLKKVSENGLFFVVRPSKDIGGKYQNMQSIGVRMSRLVGP
jgi:hypothetical protein